MKTKEEQEITTRVEDLCVEDYEKHVGKILKASLVFGYQNYQSVEFHLDPPARIRVLRTNPESFLNWTCNDWCDPNWDVDMIEPHPQLVGCSSLWIDGISRSIEGETQLPSGWTVDENQEGPSLLVHEPDLQPSYTHTIKALCPHCCKDIEIETATFVKLGKNQ